MDEDRLAALLRPEWQSRARCHGYTDIFPFDYSNIGNVTKGLDAIWMVRETFCNVCPVARECYEFGKQTGSQGMWGGAYMVGGRTYTDPVESTGAKPFEGTNNVRQRTLRMSWAPDTAAGRARALIEAGWVDRHEIAREAGCSYSRVYEVIAALRNEGFDFEAARKRAQALQTA